MKKLIIFLLLINAFSYAQNTTYIEYNVVIGNEDIFKGSSNLRLLFEQSIKDASNIKFGLICKKNKSYYYHINNIVNTTDNTSFKSTSLIFAGYNGEIYKENDSIFTKSNLLVNETYIKKTDKIDWILKDEKKVIDGYECFKATCVYIVKNPKGDFHHPVIAWYCLTIPFSHGPKGYGGLPGLILELQVRNVIYGVKLIDFKSSKDFDFNRKKKRILTEKQLDEELEKFNDFDKE